MRWLLYSENIILLQSLSKVQSH